VDTSNAHPDAGRWHTVYWPKRAQMSCSSPSFRPCSHALNERCDTVGMSQQDLTKEPDVAQVLVSSRGNETNIAEFWFEPYITILLSVLEPRIQKPRSIQ